MLEMIVGANHIIALVIMSGALASEYFLFRRGMSTKDVEKVLVADSLHLLSLFLLVITGFIRMHWLDHPQDYYLSNDVFLLKVFMVGTIVVLSLYPSLTFWKWRYAIKHNKASLITRQQQQLIFWSIRIELFLLLIIPMLSSMVRHGYQ